MTKYVRITVYYNRFQNMEWFIPTVKSQEAGYHLMKEGESLYNDTIETRPYEELIKGPIMYSSFIDHARHIPPVSKIIDGLRDAVTDRNRDQFANLSGQVVLKIDGAKQTYNFKDPAQLKSALIMIEAHINNNVSPNPAFPRLSSSMM